MSEPQTFIPEIWAGSIKRELLKPSPLFQMSVMYSRRGHYVKVPRWVRRCLPRRGWVWDESSAEFAARIAAMPPVVIRTVRGDAA